MPRTAARSRLRSVLRVGAPLLLILLLGGCLLPPEPKTDAGRDVFNLYIVVLILAGIVFVAVEGFILYAVVRYRRKPGDDTLPEQLHGNTTVEIIWTLIPTVIVFILFGFSIVTLAEVEARVDEPGVTIEVEGYQWNWLFTYPDGVSVGPQGTEPPTLYVPVGEPVRLVLHTRDVIHAFYVPEFLIKRDLVQYSGGRGDNELEFTVTEAGTYCGAMRRVLRHGSRQDDLHRGGHASSRFRRPDRGAGQRRVAAPALRRRMLHHDRDQGEQHPVRHRRVRGPGRDGILHRVREPGGRPAQRRASTTAARPSSAATS